MNDSEWTAGQVEEARQRHVVSCLVRFWLEPREIGDGSSPLRGYIRHLQTGEEQYISDPQMVIGYILRQLGYEYTERVAGNARESSVDITDGTGR